MPKLNNYLSNTTKLIIIASFCLFGLYALQTQSKDKIAQNSKNYLLASLQRVLPQNAFDNDLLSSKQISSNLTLYQACLKGQPSFQIIELHTLAGYNGEIKLLASLDKNNNIYKIIPLFHRETPGLGDQIDVNKSDWLTQFQLNIVHQNSEAVALKQNGGIIDNITGATITARAVTQLLQSSLFNNSEILVKQPNYCQKNSPASNKQYEN